MPKRGGRATKSTITPQDDEGSHIVFGDAKSTKKKDKQKESAAPSGANATQDGTGSVSQKSDTRSLIGGASWTGKLPVNLLSEHCQKQKWAKPEYTMSQNANGFSSMVILLSTNPKTRETTTLPPFKLPPDMKHLTMKPTALEARHFAATYALFRVCSMKNIHMMLPPAYRDLWKQDFQELKSADVKDGKGWMYEADPFAALAERVQIQALNNKKREERDKQKAKEAENSTVTFSDGNATSSRQGPSKVWTRAPRLDMGRAMRADIEKLIRQHAVWNPNHYQLGIDGRKVLVEQIAALGFRKSHAEEAVDDCSDREEALEWLLIHVPEDDLPKWAFPEGYTAGVSLASGDMKKQASLSRLAESGYSPDLCADIFSRCGGDEGLACERLQELLLRQEDVEEGVASSLDNLDLNKDASEEAWREEQETLVAIYGARFHVVSGSVAELQLDINFNAPPITLQIRKSSTYPTCPPVINLVRTTLPAQVKLSMVRQAATFAAENLLGEPMVFALCDWLEAHSPSIIENPGKLKLVAAAATGSSPALDGRSNPGKIKTNRPKPSLISRTVGIPESMRLLTQWKTSQELPAQQTMLQTRKTLPAWRMQNDIVNAVSLHQVTIIAGETGSGKSTQTVQFLLDDMINRQVGIAANMICTQPRRISALGLADRVSAERCSAVGDEIGYAIRGEAKQSENTKVSFVTTGVLLRRLQTSGGTKQDLVSSLSNISHVIIDEVHERSLDTDFLLVLLRDVLDQRRDLKLILMSATLDATIFKDYFQDVGMVTIEGRTFPVEDHYLDEIVQLTSFSGKDSGIAMLEDSMDETSVSKAIQNVGMKINYDLIRSLVDSIHLDLGSVVTGGILIFMPGTMEINHTLDALRSLQYIHALPLHASLTPTEQRRVFPSPPRSKRKVIVTTNVAETSITIEDIVVVIDTGRVKETSFDSHSNMVKLQEVWASRAACKQRRGRAGRVRAGQCYKLFTRNAEAKMAERADPEIKRVPLEQLCLSVRAMGIVDVQDFLANAITPPENLAVDGAMQLLGRIGALSGDRLTALGRHLSMIPADLRCGKLIVYGASFGCLEACITIAAILTARNPFVSPQGKRDESKAVRSSFAPGQGDLICDLRAYEEWSERKRTSSFRDLRYWCEEHFLSSQTLQDISSNRSQYLSSLRDIGFLPSAYDAGSHSNLNAHNANTALLRALIAGAFSPQVSRIDFPDKKFAPSVSGAVELDPEARTIKYFNEENGRVFIHPSSTLFDAQTFPGNAVFMSYFSKMATSKVFMRELTPFNAYSLLMFGGKFELDTTGRGLVVDRWLRLKGWARIGVLISRLRSMLDDVLSKKIEDPGLDVSGTEVVTLVRRLVELDGLDR